MRASTAFLRTIPLGIALVSTIFIAGVASAAILHVEANGSGPYATIQAAVNAFNTGDTIELGDGVFQGDGNWEVAIGDKAVRILSASGNPSACTVALDGHRFMVQSGQFGSSLATSGVRFQTGTVIVSSMCSSGFTNCVFENLTHLSVSTYVIVACTDCVFTGGVGDLVQAVNPGRLTFTRCTLAGHQGRIGDRPHMNVSFTDCALTNNTATGSLFACTGVYQGSAAHLTRCIFEGNTVGSAILQTGESCNLTITSCTFWQNSGPAVIGISASGYPHGWADVTVNVQQSTFGMNSGSGPELKLVMSAGIASLTIGKSIFASRNGGPAVSCSGSGISVGVTCTDVFGNSGGDWVGCIAGFAGSNGNLSADPLFCMSAGSEPYMLHDASPCVPGACGLIGAQPVGCTGSVAVVPTSWGRVKNLYR